ncbi:hypothetical protein SNEBB_009712 [Seison nebaliae]|nr:hypothetical protein SNEBB_009712 [Seison nebaliae]
MNHNGRNNNMNMPYRTNDPLPHQQQSSSNHVISNANNNNDNNPNRNMDMGMRGIPPNRFVAEYYSTGGNPNNMGSSNANYNNHHSPYSIPSGQQTPHSNMNSMNVDPKLFHPNSNMRPTFPGHMFNGNNISLQHLHTNRPPMNNIQDNPYVPHHSINSRMNTSSRVPSNDTRHRLPVVNNVMENSVRYNHVVNKVQQQQQFNDHQSNLKSNFNNQNGNESLKMNQFNSKRSLPLPPPPSESFTPKKQQRVYNNEYFDIHSITQKLKYINPTIPVDFVRKAAIRNGIKAEDVRVLKLLSLCTQKFITDIISDSWRYYEGHSSNGSGTNKEEGKEDEEGTDDNDSKSEKEKKIGKKEEKTKILSMEILSKVLKNRYGITLDRPPYLVC